jgi:hypothetical protein
MLPSIQQVNDPVERGAIASEVADFLNVDRDVIRESFRRVQVPKPVQKTRDISSAVPPNEKLLLSCLLLSAEAREAIKEYVGRTDLMHLLELRKIFEAVLALDAEGVQFSVEALASRLEPGLQQILTDLSFSELGIKEEDAAYQAVHCLRALEAKAVNAACTTLRQRIQELEKRGEFAEALRLADELNKTKSASSGP